MNRARQSCINPMIKKNPEYPYGQCPSTIEMQNIFSHSDHSKTHRESKHALDHLLWI